jgi:hypothetical protein
LQLEEKGIGFAQYLKLDNFLVCDNAKTLKVFGVPFIVKGKAFVGLSATGEAM